MSRRRWLVLGSLVAVGVMAVIVWRVTREEPRARRRVSTSRLDVAAFRAELAKRVRRAKLVVAPPPVVVEPVPRSKAWEKKGSGPMKGVKDLLLEPQCWVGPMSLCDALQPLAEACAEGDARSCIAIGQYLSEEPPRILIASIFFHAACRIGDEDGCRRLDALEPGAPGTCEEDPFACQWRAYKAKDFAMHEQACSLGAAESCAMLAFEEKDAERRLAYYETACQLGHTMACDVIVQLVSPSCEDHDGSVCLPVDEEAAARAKAIACEAGFTERCSK